MGRRGVVWDREGEEGMELGGLYRGRDGKVGCDRKEGRKEEEDDLAPQTKFLDPPLPSVVSTRQLRAFPG
jgi:hypothetical protein